MRSRIALEKKAARQARADEEDGHETMDFRSLYAEATAVVP